MHTDSGPAHIVLDFDGTCTQIPRIFEPYLDLYLKGLNESVLNVTAPEWSDAQDAVRRHSPKAGWTAAGCPAAPAAADPYILADEAAKLILRRRRAAATVPLNVHTKAYEAALAPWREEACDTFSRLVEHGVHVHFVSNSSTTFITRRLQELFGDNNPVRGKICVQSDAGKFRICELNWDDQAGPSAEAKRRFQALPVAYGDKLLIERPIYLRRGAYLEAIDRVVNGDFDQLTNTVFCGDIWEMDLAMPYALGAKVHLLDRAAPFETYPYERQALAGYGARGKTSVDLSGLLDWL
jgi:phosphoserine phosphatase